MSETKGWNKDKKWTDKSNEYVEYFNKEGKEEERTEKYESVVNHYYDLATDFYEYGWGESFHFGTRFKGESHNASLTRHEHFLALRLGLKKGDKVLDMGCGVGGPARCIARFADCHVTGINNNEYQVTRAKKHTERDHLSDKVSFVKGNFMKMPFKDNTFDNIYAIEATCHAPDKLGVYGEAFRALKPGGCFAAYEWCMTDKYDKDNASHREIKLGIEKGDGIPDLKMTWEVEEALKEVGFEILEVTDLALESEVPWYECLNAGFSLEGFRHTRLGVSLTHIFVKTLEAIGLAQPGTTQVHDFLLTASKYLVAGGKNGTFTPMHFFLVRKPLN